MIAATKQTHTGLDISEELMIIPALLLVLLNIFFFQERSHSIYTINLIICTLGFLFLSKYYDYYDSQPNSTILSIVFFYVNHQMLRSIVVMFNKEADQFVNISFPEVNIKHLTNDLMTNMKNEQGRKDEGRDRFRVGDPKIRDAIYDNSMQVTVDKKRRPEI